MISSIKNVVFYNRWHNGDLFLPKGYMVRLIESLRKQGEFKFYFAHKNSSKLLQDIDATYIPLKNHDIPAQDHHTVLIIDDTMYINTWVGAYKGFFNPLQEHSNIVTISYIWFSIFYTIQSILGVKLFRDYQERFYPLDGIATTDWSKFDLQTAKKFLKDKTNLVLFCNGAVRSAQTRYSNIDLMANTIQDLALRNPDHNFICTQKVELFTDVSNVFFTDDIFAGMKDGDINEIAYLSTFCKMIIGKSSGPHMYCHVKENLSRDCIFFTVGDRQSDDYLYNLFDMNCTHMFFIGKQEKAMANILNKVLKNEVQYFKHSLVSDDQIFELRKTLDARNY